MNLKTYQAETMAQALANVRRDLGKDAVILHTRTLKKGGFWGIGTKTVVEITATSGVNVLHPSQKKNLLKTGGKKEPLTSRLESIAPCDSSSQAHFQEELGLVKQMVQ